MLEKEIEKKVCDYAKTKGFLVYKFVSPGHAFVPDRMLISPEGEVSFIEFKAEGKKPTAGQEREHTRLRESNVRVFVVDSVQMGIEVVDVYLGGWLIK